MGIVSDFALLHAAERLVATHKAALADVEPLLSLARRFFEDGDGNVSRDELFDALRRELNVLEHHHQFVASALDGVRAIVPDPSDPPAEGE